MDASIKANINLFFEGLLEKLRDNHKKVNSNFLNEIFRALKEEEGMQYSECRIHSSFIRSGMS
jgi:hypothetical protein